MAKKKKHGGSRPVKSKDDRRTKDNFQIRPLSSKNDIVEWMPIAYRLPVSKRYPTLDELDGVYE